MSESVPILEGPGSLPASSLPEGSCVRCEAVTQAVMLFDGDAAFLCVDCQQKIRAGKESHA